MSRDLFPRVLFEVAGVAITDTLAWSVALTVLLALGAAALVRIPRTRDATMVVYAEIERSIQGMIRADARPLMPLILTQWLFLGVANLIGLVPGIASPTRDVSIAIALALVAFGAGHYFGLRTQGLRYLRQYIEPNPLMLPFNLIGEVSRTLAMALRLFGNMLSGTLVVAIVVYLAGLLLPIPLMLLSVLTAVVQAYIFGMLTLVFTAGSMEAATREPALAAEPGRGTDS